MRTSWLGALLAAIVHVDATSAPLTIDTAVPSVRTGSLCDNEGYECVLFERMKFFQTDIDDAGNLYIAYAKDRGIDAPLTSDLMIAVQSGGPRLR